MEGTTNAAPAHGAKHRYATAIVLIIVFIIAVRFLDEALQYLIYAYFPGFASYAAYVSYTANAILGVFGAYVVYRVLLSVINRRQLRGSDIGNTEIAKLVLRILFYFAAIAIVLVAFGPTLGISLSQALAGSAVGGIILGLAVQTVVSSILSGVLVSSSKTVTPGDVLIMHASAWGDIVCKVLNVNILFTECATQNGNRIRVPNTILMNSATFTKLKVQDEYSYAMQVTMSSDVSAAKLADAVQTSFRKEFPKRKLKVPEVYLSSKISGANVFTVILGFDNFADINRILDMANRVFDVEYWKLKKAG